MNWHHILVTNLTTRVETAVNKTIFRQILTTYFYIIHTLYYMTFNPLHSYSLLRNKLNREQKYVKNKYGICDA